MRHGFDAYRAELARHQVRIARIGLAVSAVALAVSTVATWHPVARSLNRALRFGYEGPEQYVRRILLETVADVEQPGANTRNIMPIELRKGGGTPHPSTSRGGMTPGAEHTGVGPGSDVVDLVSRLRALALAGPVVRSEELVVESLVRPEYPEDARERNIEGVVELFAMVDTTGHVSEVHIAGGSHQPLLERAATDAVLQCRYRPYRPNDVARSVWAYFRISFTLY